MCITCCLCVCVCSTHAKGWNWPQPLTTYLHGPQTSSFITLIRLQSNEMTSDRVCRVTHGWVINLYQQSAQKWVFTAIKSCLIRVMAHRKALKIHNNSAGNSRFQCALFPRICQTWIIGCKRRGLTVEFWGKSSGLQPWIFTEIHLESATLSFFTCLVSVHVHINICLELFFPLLVAFLMSTQTNITKLSLYSLRCANLYLSTFYGELRKKNGLWPCQDVAWVLGQTTGSKHCRDWY